MKGKKLSENDKKPPLSHHKFGFPICSREHLPIGNETYCFLGRCIMKTGKNDIKLLTPGVISALLKVPLHRILYILSTRTHIKPAARAGTLRLYRKEAIAQIRHELNAIDAKRCNRGRNDHAK